MAVTESVWNEVWDSFDKRQKAKATKPAANEDAESGDMFSAAGVAAE